METQMIQAARETTEQYLTKIQKIIKDNLNGEPLISVLEDINNNNGMQAALFGYWNGDYFCAGNTFGNYHVRIQFTQQGIKTTVTKPDGNIVSCTGFDSLIQPAQQYNFAFITRTGHNGIVHMDYDNVYITKKIETPVYTCNDSDGGINYYVKGTITGSMGTGSYEDYCLSQNTLIERYCNPVTPSNFTKSYDCTSEGKICQEGACIIQQNTTSKEGLRIVYQKDFLINKSANKENFVASYYSVNKLLESYNLMLVDVASLSGINYSTFRSIDTGNVICEVKSGDSCKIGNIDITTGNANSKDDSVLLRVSSGASLESYPVTTFTTILVNGSSERTFPFAQKDVFVAQSKDKAYLLRLQGFIQTSGKNSTDVKNLISNVIECEDVQNGGTCILGDIALKINDILSEDRSAKVSIGSDIIPNQTCQVDSDCPADITTNYCSPDGGSACVSVESYSCYNNQCERTGGGGCGRCLNGCDVSTGLCVTDTQCDNNECSYDNKCIVQGDRIDEQYCYYGTMLGQKEAVERCNNNYECQSNQCFNGQCTDVVGALGQQSNFLKRLGCRILSIVSLGAYDYNQCLLGDV